MSDDPIASDGLVARNSGPWAEDKLAALDRYVAIFTRAMTEKFANGLVFVDLMAGPGVCVDTRSVIRREFNGSTLRALDARPVFSHVVAIESDADYAAALRARARRHPRWMACDVRHADCNRDASIDRVREVTRSALGLMFVDLIGTEVEMDTLRQMTTGRHIDLVITWPEMDAQRNRGMLVGAANRARWQRFLGSASHVDRVARVGPARRVRELRVAYVEELNRLGYVCEFHPAVRNLRGGILYRPLFATRHALGLKFWGAARPRPPQQGLFE